MKNVFHAQRIGLARALYAKDNSDIFLMDDPLSAVDPKVAVHIFEQVLLRELKAGFPFHFFTLTERWSNWDFDLAKPNFLPNWAKILPNWENWGFQSFWKSVFTWKAIQNFQKIELSTITKPKID